MSISAKIQPILQTSIDCASDSAPCLPLQARLSNALTYLGVLLEAQHDLWSPVPSGSDVFGHVPVTGVAAGQGRLRRPGQSKVADL